MYTKPHRLYMDVIAWVTVHNTNLTITPQFSSLCIQHLKYRIQFHHGCILYPHLHCLVWLPPHSPHPLHSTHCRVSAYCWHIHFAGERINPQWAWPICTSGAKSDSFEIQRPRVPIRNADYSIQTTRFRIHSELGKCVDIRCVFILALVSTFPKLDHIAGVVLALISAFLFLQGGGGGSWVST